MSMYLDNVIAKSRHLSLICRCAHILWGNKRHLRSNAESGSEIEVECMTKFFSSTLVFINNSTATTVDDQTFWFYVKVKNDFTPGDDLCMEKSALPSHEKKLLSMITKDNVEDLIDEGEFCHLFGTEPHGNDDESLCSPGWVA